MTDRRPVALPTSHPFYLARSKRDGTAVALVEAKDQEQAAQRVAYVVGRLELSEWQEVGIEPASGYLCGVPTFLDGFFQSSRTEDSLQ